MRKVLLVILDGWGHSDFEGPPSNGNAIEQADVPTFRSLYASRPRTRIACSGADVGLPEGQMGNSEVGHLNLGAGRVVHQDIARIDAAAEDGSLSEHLGLSELVTGLRERNGVLHVIGLISDGGVHSHVRHLAAMLELVPTDVPLAGPLPHRRARHVADRWSGIPEGGRVALREGRRLEGRLGHGSLLGHGPGQALGADEARIRPDRWR